MFDAIRAVLFDFDGTLIQQTIDFGAMRHRVLQVVERHGLDAAPYATMHVLELIERVETRLDATCAGAGGCFAEEAHAVVTAVELAAAEGAEPFAGVPELLLWLRDAGYRVGIVTRNCRLAVERVLARRPLARDVLLTRDDVARVKPDPEHLLVALERLGVPPEDAVMCGDHPMDVMAGKRAGTATVGILSAALSADGFAGVGPDLVLPSVVDLAPYLRQRRLQAPDGRADGCRGSLGIPDGD
ncbi:MAG TPA: HAD-IA family hydrolase [Chloroflexi bacterium]|jgi:phosphoglycolate phosphatase|nr:HAD-IA family hydrolase [Chloroflexota bacterium]